MKRQSPLAFTLIEMVVSLTIMSIIFLTMGSILMLTAKAVPDPTGPDAQAAEAAQIVQQITDELQTATSVTNAQSHGIVFTVPDRDNDTADETISYSWGGAAGDPLIRVYNNGAPVELLSGINDFTLNYNTITAGTSPTVTSGEVLLDSHDPPQLAKDETLWTSDLYGQCIAPQNLPADTVSWSVTRLMFKARSLGSASGEARVQLRLADSDGTPQPTVLQERTMYESAMASSYSWQEFAFSSVTGLGPGQGVCLVMESTVGGDTGEFEYDNNSGSGYMWSTNGGSSWTLKSGMAMTYYLYGTYDTPDLSTWSGDLNMVSISLKPSNDPATHIRALEIVLNKPTMP